ncbi:hypothetical protein [Daejeonella lutea]|uniref:Uncharacterized protein n=1 Tax=Daejeonella lutea TaxID=572036 RepID=A0A1T5B1X0_9SPHI|nr:hypothetical protein [Daejeonella lutea]SKB41204.1 hypothetical protein SAMN05661099_1210 [Daejeonella lutea]
MRKIFYFILLLAACKGEPNPRFKSVDDGLKKTLSTAQLSNTKNIILIPRAGCGGCIDNAIGYLKPRIDSLQQVEIIFTGISDKKLLKLIVGEDFLKKKNVHIDSLNHFLELKAMSVYPQIVSLEEGNVSDIKELDVESNDMRKLLN